MQRYEDLQSMVSLQTDCTRKILNNNTGIFLLKSRTRKALSLVSLPIYCFPTQCLGHGHGSVLSNIVTRLHSLKCFQWPHFKHSRCSVTWCHQGMLQCHSLFLFYAVLPQARWVNTPISSCPALGFPVLTFFGFPFMLFQLLHSFSSQSLSEGRWPVQPSAWANHSPVHHTRFVSLV